MADILTVPQAPDRRLAAIMAADIAGYSRLMGQDDVATVRDLKAHQAAVLPMIARYGGSIIDTAGDGILAEFPSAVRAVECAVSLQQTMADRNRDVPEERRMLFRIGVTLGDIIHDKTRIYGDGVNIAARLQALAEPGGICVSRDARSQVRDRLPYKFADLGEHDVKNIARPVRVFGLGRGDIADLPRASAAPPAPQRRLRPSKLAGAVVALIVLAVGGGLAWHHRQSPGASPLVVAAATPAIAVLPFDDLSSDQSLRYFGDGVSEDIISMLSRFPDISVVARNSSFVYQGKPIDVRQIGRDLAVDFVLEGSVRKEAEQVRIVAQLIDARTGAHVWADHYDKAGKDPWALQDEVTTKIISAMTGETGQIKQGQYREAWGKDTTNLAEYDYYLRGHDIFMRAQSKQENDQAGRIWQEGLIHFPNSSLLKVKIGWYHFQSAYNWWSDDLKADYSKAGQLTKEVLAEVNLPPQVKKLAYWLHAFVLCQEENFDRALDEAYAAVKLSPYDANMLGNLTEVLIMSGKPEEALDWIAKAAPRDQGSSKAYSNRRGWAYRVLGRYDEFLTAYGQGVLTAPDPFLSMAIDRIHLGQLDAARLSVNKALAIDPSFTRAKWRIGYFYSDPSIVEGEVTDLAKAGLPE